MNAPKDVKREMLAFVAEIDRDELFVRIAEIGIGIKRPKSMKPHEAASELLAPTGNPHTEKVIRDFYRMAEAALEYFAECIRAGRAPS